MGRVYLVRHGRTEWNTLRVFRGHADVDLDDGGRAQARRTAKALSDVAPACVYTSPLSRSRHTAEILAKAHRLVARVDAAFTDIDYGTWTGRTEAAVRKEFPRLTEQWRTAPHTVRFPDGESLDQVRRRAVTRLRELVRQREDGDIILVSHRVVLKMLLCEARGWDNARFWDVRVDPCGVCTLETDGRHFELITENDTRHLKPLGSANPDDF